METKCIPIEDYTISMEEKEERLDSEFQSLDFSEVGLPKQLCPNRNCLERKIEDLFEESLGIE